MNGQVGTDSDYFRKNVVDLIPSLRGYARSLTRNAVDADDLVQETLLRGIRHADSFRPGTNLRAWLFTIMRNRFYTSIQKRTREPVGAADCVSVHAVTEPTQDQHMEFRDVARAFSNLPEPFRATMQFVVVGERSYLAAAQHFQCEVGTIKSRINRGRRMMRDVISPP